MATTYQSPVYQPSMDWLNGSDYSSLANYAPPPTLAAPDLGALSTVQAGASPSVLGGIGDWFNNSGILGKTLGDGTKVQGWGSPALGAASGLLNGYLGFQQLKLAKDAAAQNKRQFEMNYAAQTKTTNAALEDRQRARVASNSSAYQSVGDYMKQYGIGG